VSDEELVDAFTQGRISRRVFVRRLVAGGLTVSAAMAYSQSLAGGMAAAAGKPRPPKPPPKSRHHNR